VQYPLATSFDKPGGITAGSDGAVWFTIYSSDKIARIIPPPQPAAVRPSASP
jgi:streptogramin lyase